MTAPPVREIELALAHEASAHARAAAELNPLGEAEALEIGEARAVYCGQWSPVHGVLGLGLDGPVEERDLQEIERFYFRKERPPAFWLTPATHPSLHERLARDYQATKTLPVHGLELTAPALDLPSPEGSSAPPLSDWALAFSQLLDPAARETGLLALTKLHQRDTRFYLGKERGASYTYFHRGMALVPFPAAPSLLAYQVEEARKFQATFFATAAASALPKLFERTLHERI